MKRALLAGFGALLALSAVYATLTAHCPVPGLAVLPAERAMNTLKNRTAPVPAAGVDPAVTLQKLLAPGHDRGRWREDRGAEIEGWVTGVWPGAPESANCFGVRPRHRDTHIALALSPGAPAGARMITEVTPPLRARMERRGVDWSQGGLSRLTGHRVRVRGWLFFDAEHASDARNTAPGNPADWRATAWEIHPVTALEVLR